MAAAIQTDRLDLVPMTPAFLRASLRGATEEAANCIGLRLPDSWPENESVLALRLEQIESNPALQPWFLRAIGLRHSREMVGHIGFHSSPGASYLEQWSPGGVEFGFTIFPPHRRKGYAREACVGLMQWARDTHGVRAFVVTISPNNQESRALAASLGFVRVGGHEDDVDGYEDVFALNAVSAA